MPGSHQVEVLRPVPSTWRPSWRGGAPRGRCRRTPRAPRRRGTPRPGAAIVGWPGASAYAKCDHSPTTRTAPSASALRAATTRSGQSARAAPPRFRPLSTLRCTRAVVPASRAAATTSSSAQPALTDRSTSARSASAQASPGPSSQARTRGVVIAGGAQRERLVEQGGAQPGRAAVDGGARRRHQAVAVAVGLDHRQHLGRGARLAAPRRWRGSHPGRSGRQHAGGSFGVPAGS